MKNFRGFVSWVMAKIESTVDQEVSPVAFFKVYTTRSTHCHHVMEIVTTPTCSLSEPDPHGCEEALQQPHAR